jgi:hypothetical protein
VTPDPKTVKLDQRTGPGPKRDAEPKAPDNTPIVPSPSRNDLTRTDTPQSQGDVPPPPPAHQPLAVVTPRKPKPLPGLFSKFPFDTALLARPVHLPEPHTLEKLVATPGPHASQVVVPAGMYQLARSRADRPGGPRKYTVNELRVESRGIRPLTPIDLEVEPKLAENLDRLDAAQRAGKKAILNVWVSQTGECGLVRVEILQEAHPRIGKGYKHKPSVRYETLEVTPERYGSVEVEDKEWEQPGRMGPLAKRFKDQVLLQQLRWRTLTENQVAAQMNNIFRDAMQSVANQERQRQLFQRGVGGRYLTAGRNHVSGGISDATIRSSIRGDPGPHGLAGPIRSGAAWIRSRLDRGGRLPPRPWGRGIWDGILQLQYGTCQ